MLNLMVYCASQTVRDESVPTSSLMTPHKTGSHIESSLHKDVFGVISGTGERRHLLYSRLLHDITSPSVFFIVSFISK